MLIFFDLEVNQKSKVIDEIGLVSESNAKLATKKESDMYRFIKKHKGDYFIGHNIINHDLKYFKNNKVINCLNSETVIDTLLLSTLVFSERPYHKLVKDDKLVTTTINNPVNDSINTRILFYDILEQFNKLDEDLKDIYFHLLNDIRGFKGFFNYIKYNPKNNNLRFLIKKYFKYKICSNSNLNMYISSYKIELSYALSLIATTDVKSLLPAWVLKTHSMTEEIISKLRSTTCNDCKYCNEYNNAEKALNKYFNYPSFRDFDGIPLQKNAVEAALRGESLIAVFPTGGGKSLTFQLPALMEGRNTKGLTVIISPLQSLMKDQVDSLEEKNINNAVAISGLLNPIERKIAFDRIKDGDANILYIAPESLRSRSILKLLLNRQISRIVIDEAHCFSTWGHDFRVDYLYIADFIKTVQKIKKLKDPIPVSCFTATAKVDVVEDIKRYFYERLNLNLSLYQAKSGRTNLNYSVIKVDDDKDRYAKLRNLLLEDDSPTIIYSSRVKMVENVYKALTRDNFNVTYFHGQLTQEAKIENQEKFMKEEANIIVATSAFGMGIDKDNVKRVIHFDISDSLENYIQEAGRAGRDTKLFASCYILYNESDLDKHFELLNRTKLNHSEINQIWRSIKQSTKDKNNISKSALELANDAGWDDSKRDIETRVKTAVSTLEQVGYIKRGFNTPRVFADSLLAKSVEEAKRKMYESNLFDEEEIKLANRIIQHLISRKYKVPDEEIPETRVDYLSAILGVSIKEVIKIVNKLREANILSHDKDLEAYIKHNQTSLQTMRKLNSFNTVVKFIIDQLKSESFNYINLKKILSDLEEIDVKISIRDLKQFINYLDQSKIVKIDKVDPDNLKIILNNSKEESKNILEERYALAYTIVEYLFNEAKSNETVKNENKLPFSLIELKNTINKKDDLFNKTYNLQSVEDAIFLLTKIQALKIEGGFLVVYSPLNILKTEKNPRKLFTAEDYEKLRSYYQTKKEQIHIVGKYASKMAEDENDANIFVDDYFNVEYDEFINKYFKGHEKKQLKLNMTKKRYDELFGSLSEEQRAIIDDDENKRIGVLAGPGSGKTKLLVHKLASILYKEDTKTEELLMLTFSRQAALEFKERLYKLIGGAASYVNIQTFHSFAFDITERLGNEENLDNVIKDATLAIKNHTADSFKITKSVLVIDEAQDMTEDEYELINALIEYNEDIRIIAVGDDDQNIYEFRNSSSKYLAHIANNGVKYELTVNFRSKNNLVKFSNVIASWINDRMKDNEIKSYSNDLGKINIIKHESDNLIEPLVNIIKKDNPTGKTGIITRTNDEADIITGLLKRAGFNVGLIQDINDFKLYNMIEVRSFYNYIKDKTEFRVSDNLILEALNYMKEKHGNSVNYNYLEKTINRLVKNYNELYLSDLNNLIFETNYYDSYEEESILVSTFHKSKGREFDNVYILYNRNSILTDEDKRMYYVGITRAKENLTILSKMDFSRFKIENLNYQLDSNSYNEPNHLEFHLTHRDLWLDHSESLDQNVFNNLYSGLYLRLNKANELIYKNKKIAKLSNAGRNKVINYLNKGYKIKSIQLNYLVYWYKKETNNEVLLALPKIVFEKDI